MQGMVRKYLKNQKEKKKKLNQVPLFFKSLRRSQSSWTGSQGPPLPAPSQGHTSAPVSTVGRAPTFALTSPLPTSLGEALRTMDRAGRTGPMAPLSTHLPEAGAQAQPASWLPRGRGSQERASSPRKGAWSPQGLDPAAGEPWKRQNWSLGSASRNQPRTHHLHHLGGHGAERRAGRLPCQSTCGEDYKGGFGLGGCAGYPPSQVEQGLCPSSLQ